MYKLIFESSPFVGLIAPSKSLALHGCTPFGVFCFLLALFVGITQEGSFAGELPSSIRHILTLQTPAYPSLHPYICNTNFFKDSTQRMSSDLDNQNATDIYTFAGTYAFSYAQCALHNTDASGRDFDVAMTSEMLVDWLAAAKGLGMGNDGMTRAKAGQARRLIVWVLRNSADANTLATARYSLKVLNALHLREITPILSSATDIPSHNAER